MEEKSKIISLIQNLDQLTYNNLLETFPRVYSFLMCIRTNKNSETVEKSVEKINSYLSKNKKFKTRIQKLLSSKTEKEKSTGGVVKNDVAGKIIVLDKSEPSYEKLIQTAKKENWEYKGIAIVETFDSIRLYFY